MEVEDNLKTCRFVPRASSPSDPYAGSPCGSPAVVVLEIAGLLTARCGAHRNYGLVGKKVKEVPWPSR